MLQKFNPKNKDILVYVNGKIVPRQEAVMSVFDSSVQGGDAVWEGLRVYNGKVFCLNEHLDRLKNSATALAFEQIPSNAELKEAIYKTLEANGMRDGAHIRLTLTRGEKITSGMDPRLNQSGCSLIVLAEWKPPVYPPDIVLITAKTRRNHPFCLDSSIHHANLLNNILAKIEANKAGADDAIMLDMDGYVSETNATNIFLVKNGKLKTPAEGSCLPGITRGLVLKLANEIGIPAAPAKLTIEDFYAADEVFVTGTMGELTRVREIDKQSIINRSGEKLLEALKHAFREYLDAYCR